MIFIMAHLCGCGFIYVTKFNVDNDSSLTWLKKYNFDSLQWQEQYLQCLYFAFITMITVGYGDITPVSLEEKIYVILMTLISCGQFAYSINTIGTIF